LDFCSFAQDDAASRFFSVKLCIEQQWCLVELLSFYALDLRSFAKDDCAVRFYL